jgi:cytochrome c-type biogenesis protein CcmH/NrfF
VASGGLPAGSAGPGAQAPSTASSSIGWLAPVVLIVVVVIVIAVLVARRRRGTTDEAS